MRSLGRHRLFIPQHKACETRTLVTIQVLLITFLKSVPDTMSQLFACSCCGPAKDISNTPMR
jgi:hypothetical protein